MSDLKKIKDEFVIKLKGNLNLTEINQIKSNVFNSKNLSGMATATNTTEPK